MSEAKHIYYLTPHGAWHEYTFVLDTLPYRVIGKRGRVVLDLWVTDEAGEWYVSRQVHASNASQEAIDSAVVRLYGELTDEWDVRITKWE